MARVKLKRIETSICSIINIKLSTPIFGLPMIKLKFMETMEKIVTIFVKKEIKKNLKKKQKLQKSIDNS